MRIDVHVHFEPDTEVLSRLDVVLEKLNLVIKKEDAMSKELDDLTAAVAAEDAVIDSAVTLINGIPALIAAAGTDPAKLKALSDDITAKSAALAAAVTANTPAAVPAPAPDA